MRFRRCDVEKSYATARDARRRKHCMEHAGRMMIGGIFGGTNHFEHAVAARERLPNIRPVANVYRRLRDRDLRHG
jgi:hypothetical protein